MESSKNLILFMGAPGSGKGTQANLLSKHINYPHIDVGELLRENIALGTNLGRIAKIYMAMGKLVPDEIIAKLIIARVNQPDCKNGVIMDGAPRTMDQAKLLTRLFKKVSQRNVFHNQLIVFYFAISDEMSQQRIISRGKNSGRLDDINNDIINQRFFEYNEKTRPVIKHFEKVGRVNYVNAGDSVESIQNNINLILNKRKIKSA